MVLEIQPTKELSIDSFSVSFCCNFEGDFMWAANVGIFPDITNPKNTNPKAPARNDTYKIIRKVIPNKPFSGSVLSQ